MSAAPEHRVILELEHRVDRRMTRAGQTLISHRYSQGRREFLAQQLSERAARDFLDEHGGLQAAEAGR